MCCNSYTINQFGCKAERLHLKHILMVSFQVHCGGVQCRNGENCVSVQIFMDLTVYSMGENREI